MVNYRIILAGLIALAVAVAPFAAALLAGPGAARAASAATARDCHGHKASGTDDAATGHHGQNKGGCPDCGGQRHDAKCIDGGKCCKLTGMVAVLPVVIGPAETVDLALNPPALVGWQVRPPPPPPRT